MNKDNDLRLIEDYLPIEAISAEASREKSVRKGHTSTLHLWWARRPLVACRAAAYGALVPADRWVKDVDLKNPPTDAEKAAKTKNGKKKGLNRKAAKEFVTKLCRYPKTNPTKLAEVKAKAETEAAIVEAQRHILEAHAERLTAELAEATKTGKPPAWVDEFKFQGEKVTYDDIVAGQAPRPRVLDMFAGGAIPLEAFKPNPEIAIAACCRLRSQDHPWLGNACRVPAACRLLSYRSVAARHGERSPKTSAPRWLTPPT